MKRAQSILAWLAARLEKQARRWRSGQLYGLAGLLQQQAGNSRQAADSFQCATEQTPTSLLWLRLCAQSKEQAWQQRAVLEQQQQHFADNPAYWLQLGIVQQNMGSYAEAQFSFEQALQRKKSAKTYWRLGAVQAQLENHPASLAAFAQAEKLAWQPAIRRLGVGHWFAQEGDWHQAVAAYTRKLDNLSKQAGSRKARLLFARAYAFQRLQDWPGAAADYLAGMQQSFRPGLLEPAFWACIQAGRLQQAESLCREALHRRGRKPEKKLYKWLAIAQSQYHPEQAADHFQRYYALSSSETEPLAALLQKAQLQPHAKQVICYLKAASENWHQQNWAQAGQNLAAAIDRWPEHSAELYLALAHAEGQQGRYRTAVTHYLQAELFFLPSSENQYRNEKNQGIRRTLEYLEYRQNLPLRANCVLYESYVGASISCNPYAIFQAIVDASAFAGWLHVWVLNDTSQLPLDWQPRTNVLLVERDSTLYQRYLATAQWIIGNNTLRPHFVRRSGQKYLNTWHGTPLKTLGKDIPGFLEHKGAARSFLQASHLLLPNAHTRKVLLERYDLDGIYQGAQLTGGAPRNDFLLTATPADKKQIRQQLGLPENGRPVVLYAPTWRGSLSGPDSGLESVLADLKALQALDCTLVFRGHHLVERQLQQLDSPGVYLAPQAIDTSRVLAVTDVLVTDYSSILFDFLLTGQPLVLYGHDEDSYRAQRGLYFDLADMPSQICRTRAQLADTLTKTLQSLRNNTWQPNAAYLQARQLYCPHDDGQATERVIEQFFQPDSLSAVLQPADKRTSLLFFAGHFQANGITTAFINLVRRLDPERYRIVVVVDSAIMAKDQDAIRRLQQLPAQVQVIGRVGRQLLTGEERTAVASLNRLHRLGEGQQHHYQEAFRREFKRMFGDWQPDHIIHYEGYSCLWAGILGCGAPEDSQRLIYLHNDMQREWHSKHAYLQTLFGLYSYFDRLVSVSAAIRQTNRTNLGPTFRLPAEKFVHASNLPDFPAVIKQATELLPDALADWLGDIPAQQVFIALGRLSPEKNHKLLLQAFADLLKKQPQARLLILGEGQLRPELEQQINQLAIHHAVSLPGAYSNPFPALARSGCLVLPSLYEGLGMVLLEAMALNKKIIATDIPPVRELLQSGAGVLVAANPQALATAMEQAITGTDTPAPAFDAPTYTTQALEQFYAILK